MQGFNHDQKQGESPEVRWRVTTPTGDRFACRVCASGARIEVQLTTGQDDLVCARVVPSFDAARDSANRWLRAVLADDNVVEGDATPLADIVH